MWAIETRLHGVVMLALCGKRTYGSVCAARNVDAAERSGIRLCVRRSRLQTAELGDAIAKASA